MNASVTHPRTELSITLDFLLYLILLFCWAFLAGIESDFLVREWVCMKTLKSEIQGDFFTQDEWMKFFQLEFTTSDYKDERTREVKENYIEKGQNFHCKNFLHRFPSSFIVVRKLKCEKSVKLSFWSDANWKIPWFIQKREKINNFCQMQFVWLSRREFELGFSHGKKFHALFCCALKWRQNPEA